MSLYSRSFRNKRPDEAKNTYLYTLLAISELARVKSAMGQAARSRKAVPDILPIADRVIGITIPACLLAKSI